MNWQQFEELNKQLRGLRFVSFGGILKEYREILKLDDVEDGDLIYEDEVDRDNWKKIAEIVYGGVSGQYGLDYYTHKFF